MARPALKLASGGYILRSGEIRRSGSIAEISASALEDEYL
jgi:branched-chain amino acid transport system ATP-binding protein